MPGLASVPGVTLDEALAVLAVSPGATEHDVRAAYRRLVGAAHPDRAGDDPDATRRTARLTQAYAVVRRALADGQLVPGRAAPTAAARGGASPAGAVSVDQDSIVHRRPGRRGLRRPVRGGRARRPRGLLRPQPGHPRDGGALRGRADVLGAHHPAGPGLRHRGVLHHGVDRGRAHPAHRRGRSTRWSRSSRRCTRSSPKGPRSTPPAISNRLPRAWTDSSRSVASGGGRRADRHDHPQARRAPPGCPAGWPAPWPRRPPRPARSRPPSRSAARGRSTGRSPATCSRSAPRRQAPGGRGQLLGVGRGQDQHPQLAALRATPAARRRRGPTRPRYGLLDTSSTWAVV